MGKKTKKPGKGKEKTERKTAKSDEKRARRETKKLSAEDDIDAILVHSFSVMIYTTTSNMYGMYMYLSFTVMRESNFCLFV